MAVRILTASLALAAVACSQPFGGTWTGTCELGDLDDGTALVADFQQMDNSFLDKDRNSFESVATVAFPGVWAAAEFTGMGAAEDEFMALGAPHMAADGDLGGIGGLGFELAMSDVDGALTGTCTFSIGEVDPDITAISDGDSWNGPINLERL